MEPRKIKRLGWKRDLPDHRDLTYRAARHDDDVALPPSVNLKPKLDLVFDQGDLSSCTANSTLWMWQFVHGAPHDDEYWSRMFLYIETLLAEQSYPQDAGAELRNVIKVLSLNGVPGEKAFPYDVKKFPSKPDQSVETDAYNNRVTIYTRLQNRHDFLNCLANGFPFVFGFTIFDPFEGDEVAKTGVVPLPGANDAPQGGHAVCCVGYDRNFKDTGKLFYLIQNSWGPDWGDPQNPGCFWLPAEYLENHSLASDFWTVRNTTA